MWMQGLLTWAYRYHGYYSWLYYRLCTMLGPSRCVSVQRVRSCVIRHRRLKIRFPGGKVSVSAECVFTTHLPISSIKPQIHFQIFICRYSQQHIRLYMFGRISPLGQLDVLLSNKNKNTQQITLLKSSTTHPVVRCK